MLGWSLAVTVPCRESKVSEVLERLDFEHYVFRVRKEVVREGRTFSLLVPAFPSYVFIIAKNCWDFIRSRTDVVGFVKFGGEVAEVPARDVQALAHRAVGKEWILPQAEPASRFSQGQDVTVCSGVFEGSAVYDRPASLGRAIILVDILGRMTPVSVAEGDVSEVKQQVRRAKHHRPKKARLIC